MTRRLWILAATTMILALAACGDDAKPPAAATPATASPAAAAAPATTAAEAGGDTYAQQACRANADAQNATRTDDPEVMRPVADAAKQSSITSISLAGRILAERVDLAEAAKGQSDEVTMGAGLTAGSFDFMTTCANAGLLY